MEEILYRMSSMSEEEITRLALTLCRRFDELHPDSELVFISLPRDDSAKQLKILSEIANQ